MELQQVAMPGLAGLRRFASNKSSENMKQRNLTAALFLLPLFVTAQIDFTPGLRSYHPTNGDYYNASSNAFTFHASFFNSSFGENAAGIENTAGFFGGANRVNLSNRLVNHTANFSVELWFRAEAETFQVLFWEGAMDQRSVWIRVEPSNNRIRCYAGQPGNTSSAMTSSAYNDGEWHHLVFTGSGANLLRVYVDGELEEQVIQGYSSGATTQFSRFGCRADLTQYLTGNLDEVRVWNYALSAAEVSALYNQPRIMVDPENLGSYCAGASVQVPFTVIGNNQFEDDNTFYLQLSNKEGSFRYPTTIGSAAGTGSGTIQATIPDDVGSGNNYRVRVVASRYPKVSDNTAGISINNPNAALGNDINSDLLLYYPFDGDATDFSGFGLDGAMSGSLVPVQDRNGNPNSALSFGSQGRVEVGAPYQLTAYNHTQDPISFSFWIRQSSTPMTYSYIFSAWQQPISGPGEGLWIGTGSFGSVMFRVNGNQTVAAPITNNAWQHFVCVYTGSQIQIYRSGNLINTSNVTGNVRILTPIEMGRNTQGFTSPQELNGRLDEFRVYGRALTAIEVSTLHQDGLARNNGPLCDGDTAQFFGPGFPDYIYDWSGPAGFSSDQQNPEFAPYNAIVHSGDYSLTLMHEGCVGTPLITHLTSDVAPVAGVQGAEICIGDSAAISASGAELEEHYRWYADELGEELIASGTASITVMPGQSTQYYVNIKPTEDCQGPITPVLVSVGADNVQASASANEICPGDEVTLTGSGAATYSWSGGAVDGVPFVPQQSTIFLLTGTDSAGCVGVDSVLVTLLNQPITPEIQGDMFLDCDAAGVVYHVESQPGLTYEWTVPDGAVFSGQGGDSIVVDFNSQFGWITVTAISPDGCVGNTEEIMVQCVTSVEELAEAGVTIYPNPVSNMLFLDLSNNSDLRGVELYDASGRLLRTLPVNPGTLHHVDVADWAVGLYILRAYNNEKTISFRVVKM